MDDDDVGRHFDPCELDDDAPRRCKYCRGTGNDGEGSNYYPCPDCEGRGWTGGEEEEEEEEENNEEREDEMDNDVEIDTTQIPECSGFIEHNKDTNMINVYSTVDEDTPHVATFMSAGYPGNIRFAEVTLRAFNGGYQCGRDREFAKQAEAIHTIVKDHFNNRK